MSNCSHHTRKKEEMLSVRQDLITFIGNTENVDNVIDGITSVPLKFETFLL